ncbi:uncharacterized protein LOC6557179 [Drosophila grimshawi]|uniref:uncharacterized protein LOC6557179 n=1 Tax=Drosophila grimshawi TaxID=7222 RepID=UPI000C86F75E|nr:uncharacterized protein LOC6557179 [Drosophila grimshawi]
MESINFNDFSEKERHDIITAFLNKMKEAESMHSAHRFFQYYLKQFYIIPYKLREDIIYCQSALKNYLTVHRTITDVFAEHESADPTTKTQYLLEIEETLHEINAECQYLIMKVEEDIDRFCLPFTEQKLHPNKNLVSAVVSRALVPSICSSANSVPVKPHIVIERPTVSQLLCKYFTVDIETVDKPIKSTASVSKKKALSHAASSKRPTTTKKTGAAIASPKPEAVATKSDVVNASRLQLKATLEKARLEKISGNSDSTTQRSKEMFLKHFDLCTQLENKRIILNQALRSEGQSLLRNKVPQ